MKKILKDVLSFIWVVIVDCFTSLAEGLHQRQGLKAEFGKEKDIASRFNKGFLISKHRKLSSRSSFENILLAGPTGSGKTTRLLIKNLFELKGCSIVINDPSKELFHTCSGYISKYFDTKVLNFSDSKASSGYNVLSRIQKPNDANKIADLLTRSTIDKGSGDPFWTLSTKSLLSVFIRLILHQPKPFQSMANVLHTVNNFAANPKVVDEWIVKTGDKKLILDYRSLVTIPERTLQNIVASAKASLELFNDPEIAKVTSFDSINFDSLRKKPTVLFLHNSISDMRYVNVLLGIFFEQLYGYILQKLPEKNEKNLYIIIEEASSLFVPVLPVAIANTRKHRVGNLLCVQSQDQLTTFYKQDAKNVVANCITKIFMAGQTSIDLLKELEIYSGKTTYTDDKGRERIQSLISVDEIRLLPKNRTLILSGNNPIIKGHTSPFFLSWKYKRRSLIPPIPIIGDIPDGPIPLLGEE